MGQTRASRRDKVIFLASTPLLATALVLSEVGPALVRAVRGLPKELWDQWEYLNRRSGAR